MHDDEVRDLIESATNRLRDAGARFAYLHGSLVAGQTRLGSDVDIAASFGPSAPYPAITSEFATSVQHG